MIQFEPLFQYIEVNLHRKISMAEAADVALFSPVHLSRLFQLAYGMTPAEYIRRRRLTESVAALQDKSRTVLEIALDFGFEHEQSFTRAFCAEFGVTPGRYRAARMELPILLPIQDYGTVCNEGRLFGPAAVYLPEIRMLGTWHDIPYKDSVRMAPETAFDFWDNTRPMLPGGPSAGVYYGLTAHFRDGRDYSRYFTAIGQNGTSFQGGQFPLDGVETAYFGGCSCIKFHYVGQHHYRELSRQTAGQMYRLIGQYVFGRKAFPGVSLYTHLEQRIIRQSNPQSTVDTRIKISHMLAALFASYGERDPDYDDGLPLDVSMFQRGAAKGMCVKCLGKGIIHSIDETKMFADRGQLVCDIACGLGRRSSCC